MKRRRILLLAASVYLLVINLPLWVGVVPQLINEPTFRINYGFAISPLPGVATLFGVRIWTLDSSNVAQIRIGSLTAIYSPRALVRQRLEVLRAWASGADLRIVTVMGPPSPSQKRTPDPTEGSKWVIDVRRVGVSRLTQAWIHGLRWRGRAQVQGAFRLQPGRELEVGPAWIEFSRGNLQLGELRLLRGTTGRLDVRIEPTDIRSSVDQDPLSRLNVGGELRAGIEHPSVATYTLKEFDSMRFVSGSGELLLRPVLEQGRFRPGTLIDAQLRDVEVEIERFKLKAQGGLRAEVAPATSAQGGELIHTQVTLDPIHWQADSALCPRDAAAQARLDIATDSPADFLTRSGSTNGIAVKLLLASSRMPSLECVIRNAFGKDLLPGLAGELGQLQVQGVVETGARKFNGQATLQLLRISMRSPDGAARAELAGELRATGVSTNYATSKFTIPSGGIAWKARRLWTKTKGWADEAWQGSVDLAPGTLDASRPGDTRVEGDLRVRLSDIRYPVRFFFPDSDILNLGASVLPMSKFAGRGKLFAGEHSVSLTRFRAGSQTGLMEADLRGDERGFRGQSLLQLTPFSICLLFKGEQVETVTGRPIDACEKAAKAWRLKTSRP